jgi:hypothetical protein
MKKQDQPSTLPTKRGPISVEFLFKLSVATIFFLSPITSRAGTQEDAKAIEKPLIKTTDPWQMTVGTSGLLTGVSGTTGFRGINSDVDVGVGQILRHINVIYSYGGEIRKGRFGVLGDLLYLNAQAGANGAGLVSKTDLGLQQFLGEFFASYLVLEGPHGHFLGSWLSLFL